MKFNILILTNPTHRDMNYFFLHLEETKNNWEITVELFIGFKREIQAR